MDDLERLMALMPYAAELGITIDTASADEVVGHLEWAPQLCTAAGLMHGGALMSLADSIGAGCAFLGLPEGASTATIDSGCVRCAPRT